jgi:hypothetical protein
VAHAAQELNANHESHKKLFAKYKRRNSAEYYKQDEEHYMKLCTMASTLTTEFVTTLPSVFERTLQELRNCKVLTYEKLKHADVNDAELQMTTHGSRDNLLGYVQTAGTASPCKFLKKDINDEYVTSTRARTKRLTFAAACELVQTWISAPAEQSHVYALFRFST